MRILIVDDSKTCRKIYTKELLKGGYDTIQAADGIEALAIIAETSVDLVLLDIEMPHLDGFEVCERLRSEEFSTRLGQNREGVLPIIFVTSNDTSEWRVKGFKKGANEYISKGFKPGSLLSIVNRILKPANPFLGLTALFVGRHDSPTLELLQGQGLTLHNAEDEKTGLNLLAQHGNNLKLVIVDLEPPRFNTIEFCRKIRWEFDFKGLPIIVLTLKSDPAWLLHLFEAGASDYLIKPFGKEEFIDRLMAAQAVLQALEREFENAQKQALNAAIPPPRLRESPEPAEFANSVLHNIGNVLNSVHVSCYQISKHMENSKLAQMLLAHRLIEENQHRLVAFLTENPKGKLLPEYLIKCGLRVEREHTALTKEIEDMSQKIKLMKDIIEAQQAYAKRGEELVETELETVLDDALKIQSGSLLKHDVAVEKHLSRNLKIKINRTTFTHLLINLVKNSVEAMAGRNCRVLTLSGWQSERGEPTLTIRDTGSGIEKNHLKCIFEHGFTTKKNGHGFGLAYCARAARDMGVDLSVHSEGPQQGATFTLVFKGDERAVTL